VSEGAQDLRKMIIETNLANNNNLLNKTTLHCSFLKLQGLNIFTYFLQTISKVEYMILLIGRMMHWKRKRRLEDRAFLFLGKGKLSMQYYTSIQKKMQLSTTDMSNDWEKIHHKKKKNKAIK
jgi:transketolase N-terminal domain/subunit